MPGLPEGAQEPELLARLDKLTFGYGKTRLFQDFSFTVREGERIWIRGGNGCGKSTLLKILSGQLPVPELTFQEPAGISVSYQEPFWTEGYARDLITDPVRLVRFLEICECLDLTGGILERPVETYSSGEKRKLDIARALSEENRILLLDEPLNYMDVYFREQLERAILALKPTIVFVEHDERFGCRVATRRVSLDDLAQAV